MRRIPFIKVSAASSFEGVEGEEGAEIPPRAPIKLSDYEIMRRKNCFGKAPYDMFALVTFNPHSGLNVTLMGIQYLSKHYYLTTSFRASAIFSFVGKI